MAQGISEVLTFAIGVAISPVPIIAVILMLFSGRATVNGPMFLAGWVVALAVVSGVEKMAEETIPIGGAGLIVAYPHSAADKVEPAVTRALQKVVGEAEGHHVKALKGALADAQQKMAQEGTNGNR